MLTRCLLIAAQALFPEPPARFDPHAQATSDQSTTTIHFSKLLDVSLTFYQPDDGANIACTRLVYNNDRFAPYRKARHSSSVDGDTQGGLPRIENVYLTHVMTDPVSGFRLVYLRRGRSCKLVHQRQEARPTLSIHEFSDLKNGNVENRQLLRTHTSSQRLGLLLILQPAYPTSSLVCLPAATARPSHATASVRHHGEHGSTVDLTFCA